MKTELRQMRQFINDINNDKNQIADVMMSNVYELNKRIDETNEFIGKMPDDDENGEEPDKKIKKSSGKRHHEVKMHE